MAIPHAPLGKPDLGDLKPSLIHRVHARTKRELRFALTGYSLHRGSRLWSGFFAQVGLLVPPSLLYFLVRDLSGDQKRVAFENAASIVGLEQALGLDWEAALQAEILDVSWAVSAMNWIYIWGHFPVIITALVALFALSRRDFLTLRNALIVSGAVGLVCFAMFPVAPPRLFAPHLFFDSVKELSSSYRVLQNPELTNQYAAVPSFHVGWNLLVAVAIWRSTGSALLRLTVIVFPILMISSVILTANHWLLDVIAGAAVAALGLAGAFLLDRLFSRSGIEPTTSEALASTSRELDTLSL